jgi:hypothetical protein
MSLNWFEPEYESVFPEILFPVIWKAQVVQGVTVSVTPPWYNGLNQ